MPHIHTGQGQHDFTASAYIIRADLPEPAVMLHQHRVLNKWLQFGGHVELDESPWQCVVREIGEEVGYTPTQLQVLQPETRVTKISHAALTPQPFVMLTHGYGNEDHFHNDIGYTFVTSEAPGGTITADESGVFKAFTRAELAALPDDTIPENVREAAMAALDTFLPAWKPLPVTNWQD
jgi:8-oxo-dGTP pyrophosphatase MutT (NUDIX family)